MKLKLKRDQWFGIVFLLFSAFLLVSISLIQPALAVDPNDTGPKFFPTLLTIGLIVCGIGLIVMPDKSDELYLNAAQWVRVGKYFGVLVFYLVLMKFLGFVVASSIGLFMIVVMLAGEKRPNKLFVAAYSVAFSLGIYLTFTRMLNVYLPQFPLL